MYGHQKAQTFVDGEWVALDTRYADLQAERQKLLAKGGE